MDGGTKMHTGAPAAGTHYELATGEGGWINRLQEQPQEPKCGAGEMVQSVKC